MTTHWINPDLQTAGQRISDDNNKDNSHSLLLSKDVECLCVGTGRFLRAVLMPLLQHHQTVIVQPRGRSFLEFMQKQQQQQQQQQADHADATKSNNMYPVDTVLRSGQVETEYITCAAAFSWGQAQDKQAFYQHLPSFISGSSSSGNSSGNKKNSGISILGLGVTEAGLASHETPVMQDLYQLFVAIRDLQQQQAPDDTPNGKICVIDMDNVPNNGSTIQRHMLTLAENQDNDDANGKSTIMSMKQFFHERVAFLNTMVDRITSQRKDDPTIPRAEPVPAKALVVLDPDGDLPSWFTSMATTTSSDEKKCGLVIRSTTAQLENDVNLKLRIANGTHTAIAHVMALLKLTMTDSLSPLSSCTTSSTVSTTTSLLLMDYLDSLARDQILLAAAASVARTATTATGVINDKVEQEQEQQAMAVWEDWRLRLTHPHFGLSTFFITQNGPAKGGIRLTPTIIDLIQDSSNNKPRDDTTTTTTVTTGIHVSMAFCFAVLLRWLTPMSSKTATTAAPPTPLTSGVFTGWLPKESSIQTESKSDSAASSTTVTYADGLQYNLDEGWYQFRCDCQVVGPDGRKSHNLSEWLAKLVGPSSSQQPAVFVDAIQAYLLAPSGGNQGSIADTKAFAIFSQAVATLYARMVAGDGLLAILQEMKECKSPYTNGFASDCSVLVDNPSTREGNPLHYRPAPIPSHSALMKRPVTVSDLNSVIASEVSSVLAIDVHTHLLPPSHGALCLWGIDELLTYHYLVAEFFMIAPASMSPDDFYSMNKQEQADCIWKSLFLDRSPVSEACRGVITTLVALGLSEEVRMRDLTAIREFYARFREKGLTGAEEFSERIFSLAGVRYNVMTNIPFDSNEAQHWRPKRKPYPNRYRSALRVDPLLAGDRRTIEAALRGSGYETTLEGARQYLRDWCDTMQPEYMMASTPHDFVLNEGTFATTVATVVNLDAMREPGAFADIVGSRATCTSSEDDSPSVINEQSDFLSQVLMKVCEERDLPIALKIGAHRGVNPQLKAAGDGVVAFADAGMLGRLCGRFAKVRFLATFLSRNNQHEACVLATKFRNLHIYGCWWFCNNPSIIKEITQMRVEMLGTSFTAQHSDARVLDQLAYKWPHSRSVIANVLKEEFAKLCSGWSPTRSDIRRDVERLFGGSYEEFMSKSLR